MGLGASPFFVPFASEPLSLCLPLVAAWAPEVVLVHSTPAACLDDLGKRVVTLWMGTLKTLVR